MHGWASYRRLLILIIFSCINHVSTNFTKVQSVKLDMTAAIQATLIVTSIEKKWNITIANIGFLGTVFAEHLGTEKTIFLRETPLITCNKFKAISFLCYLSSFVNIFNGFFCVLYIYQMSLFRSTIIGYHYMRS